jgi:E3 ubiquitin-protein ligase UBR7
MFQCLGLGTVDDGGCGEDWYHPECIMGLSRDRKRKASSDTKTTSDGALNTIQEQDEAHATTDGDANGDINMGGAEVEEDDGDTTPPGFPNEDDFEYFICFKCVEAFPWIKRYAGTDGFLMPVYNQPTISTTTGKDASAGAEHASESTGESRKRKAFLDTEETSPEQSLKRQRSVDPRDDIATQSATTDQLVPEQTAPSNCRYKSLPPAPPGKFSLFPLEDFRSSLCRCASCYPLLTPHPALLDEEDTYEPLLSGDGDGDGGSDAGPGSVGSGARSLLERGEAALSNVDRVRAIEGVMVYNHLKSKVKDFLKPFAESGMPVGAEDIKKYFETLRGDEEAIRAAGMRNGGGGDGGKGGNNRKEQSGEFYNLFYLLSS